jgi:hypothetical protein
MASKIVKIFINLLIIVCGSCAVSEETPLYLKYVHEIVNDFANEMQKEYGLVCVGSGGSMPRNVETIKVSFYIYRRGTLQEARELIVKAKTRLVEKVNAHEKIRPFLKQYPFTWEGANISLSFNKKNGSRYLDDSVAFVCSSKGGNISYDRVELQTRQAPGFQDLDGTYTPGEFEEDEYFVTILREPYEETLRIVQSISEMANKTKK